MIVNKSIIVLTRVLVEEDFNFEGITPSLFAHKTKDHVEQVKVLRSSEEVKESKQQFF